MAHAPENKQIRADHIQKPNKYALRDATPAKKQNKASNHKKTHNILL